MDDLIANLFRSQRAGDEFDVSHRLADGDLELVCVDDSRKWLSSRPPVGCQFEKVGVAREYDSLQRCRAFQNPFVGPVCRAVFVGREDVDPQTPQTEGDGTGNVLVEIVRQTPDALCRRMN